MPRGATLGDYITVKNTFIELEAGDEEYQDEKPTTRPSVIAKSTKGMKHSMSSKINRFSNSLKAVTPCRENVTETGLGEIPGGGKIIGKDNIFTTSYFPALNWTTTTTTTTDDATTTTTNQTGNCQWPVPSASVIEFAADGPGEVNVTDEEIEVFVTLDSGAIGHIGPKEAMPRGATLKTGPMGVNRDLIAANGGTITNHGTTTVELVSAEGRAIQNDFMVADVTRPLHATGPICDTGKEVLHTARGAVVVPQGALSKYLKTTMVLAKYPRKGGLYQGRFKVRVPRPKAEARDAGFGRQGARR